MIIRLIDEPFYFVQENCTIHEIDEYIFIDRLIKNVQIHGDDER